MDHDLRVLPAEVLHGDKLLEADLRGPADLVPGLAHVSDELVDLRGTEEPWGPAQPGAPSRRCRRAGRDVEQLVNGVRLTGGDHAVIGLLLPEHQPHRLDMVAGETPRSTSERYFTEAGATPPDRSSRAVEGRTMPPP